jgi:hypothetical protein
MASYMLSFFLILSTLSASASFAAHRPELKWMDGDYGNGACCGSLDCRNIPVHAIDFSETTTTVLIVKTEVTIPSDWVHSSQDGHTYVCYISKQSAVYDDDGILRLPIPPRFTRDNIRCVYINPLG